MNNTGHFVELGDRVKDSVTGFAGIATAITEFLLGCRRVQVTPPVDSNGKYEDERWVDEPQLSVSQRQAWSLPHDEPAMRKVVGGDRPDTPPR